MISGVKAAKLLAVLAATTFGISACSSGSKSDSTGDPTSTTLGIDGVQTYTGLTRTHTSDDVQYPQSPPVGGDHSSVWENCGVYDTPVANVNAVHSLEHGAVWLAYKPGLAADQVAVLAAFALNQSHILVSPYPGLTDTVVATAWGAQLKLHSVTDPRIAAFVAKYQEGPQTPELGVTCSGGIGDPVS